MKILITGTKGFIAKNLFNKLKTYENEILEINEDIFDESNWQRNLIHNLNFFNPDVVYHIGACSNTLETNVQYILTVNFEFTKILTDWVYSNKKQLIYSSSAANYGDSGNLPSNLYAWSKYVTECYVNSKNGISLRYFNVYGPGEENKGKMSSIIYQSIYHKKNNLSDFKLFPKKPTRDFIYVDDIVSANIYAHKNYNSLVGQYYDVGSGSSEPFEKILSLINLNYTYLSESDIPKGYQFYTCSDKTKWMPGWYPKFDLKKGVEDYLKKF